jgi:hypothetical protein
MITPSNRLKSNGHRRARTTIAEALLREKVAAGEELIIEGGHRYL